MRLFRRIVIALLALLPCLLVAETPESVRYVSFNIGGGAGSKYGFRQPFDLPRAGAYLKSLDADFVALQEVDKNVGRNGNPKRDTAADLAKAAGYPHVLFGKAIPLRGGEYGVALLCKKAPEHWEVVRLPVTNEPRVLIDARFRMADGKTLAIAATHLDFPSEARQRQVQAILAHFREKPADRILLAGDLNAELGSPELNLLSTVFVPLTPEPDQMTWLGGGKAIDHVFARALPGECWQALPSTRRLPYTDQAPLSDHMPILVEAKVTPDVSKPKYTAKEVGILIMEAYRKNPPPQIGDLFLSWDALCAQGLFKPSNSASLLGFFTAWVETHPESLSTLTGTAPRLKTETFRELLMSILRAVGTEPAKAALAALGASVSEEPQRPETVFRKAPSPALLDYFWGSFFATGDAARIAPILDAAFGPSDASAVKADPVTQGAAQWSLESLAKRHPAVHEALTKRQKAQPKENP